MKIAISGKSGCGNTTVSNLVARELGLRVINFTFRNLAAEKNMTLAEVLEAAKEDPRWDRETDERQVALARESGGCVLGSRLAIWLLEEADLKVYLCAGIQTRVKRIVEREGGAYAEKKAFTEKRDREDHERYLHIYRIDNDEYAFADLIIDTNVSGPHEITRQIAERARRESA